MAGSGAPSTATPAASAARIAELERQIVDLQRDVEVLCMQGGGGNMFSRSAVVRNSLSTHQNERVQCRLHRPLCTSVALLGRIKYEVPWVHCGLVLSHSNIKQCVMSP